MLTSETVLEQLEEYLDGDLDASAISSLESQLKNDSTLSQALTEVKAQRAARATVWQSMDGAAAESTRLMWRVRGEMQQQNPAANTQPKFGWGQWNFARVGSAAAACLVLGFFVGRMGRTNNPAASPAPTFTPVSNIAGNFNSPSAPDEVKPEVAKPYAVPIYDEYRRLVAYERFATQEEATKFMQGLHHPASDTGSPVLNAPKLANDEHPDEHPQVPF